VFDARWIFSDKGEIYLNGSLAHTDGSFDTLHVHQYADVPIDLIDPDDDPGSLPGPGDDTGSALTFHDYDFSDVRNYSDLEYDELRVTLGASYEVRPSVGLFGAVSRYDLDDDAPYLQDVTGAVTIVSGGITWSF
jgi:hypothetical protein